MLPIGNMDKTIQLGIRIEKDLMDRIEDLAKNEGIDRSLWIKRALATFVAGEESGMADEAIEDFIHLRIDEKTLLDYADFDKVPKDILKARETKLKNVLEEKSNGKNIHK
jgi:predicted DNA-binding protein